jgi:hypothetical protein
MRYLIALVFAASLYAQDIGFNFRETAGYVTDGASQTYVIRDTYPTTRAGFTFGWTDITNVIHQNRTLANDVRLAGINYLPAGVTADFKVDLGALGGPGDFDIRIALGDPASAFIGQNLVVKDNTTTLFTIGGSQNNNEFIDASNVVRTAAAWPGSNIATRVTVTSSFLVFTLGGSSYNTLAHIEISRVVGIHSVTLTRKRVQVSQ